VGVFRGVAKLRSSVEAKGTDYIVVLTSIAGEKNITKKVTRNWFCNKAR